MKVLQCISKIESKMKPMTFSYNDFSLSIPKIKKIFPRVYMNNLICFKFSRNVM